MRASECCGGPVRYNKYLDAMMCGVCGDEDPIASDRMFRDRESRRARDRMRNADMPGYDSYGYPLADRD